MTEALPQSQIGPVKTVLYNSSAEALKFLNEDAARIKGLSPVPTVWGRAAGRPIYDRLPSISGAYNITGFAEDAVKIFIQDQNKATGIGTLQVGRWEEDPGVLIIQSGILSWKYGSVAVEAFGVRLSLLNDGGGLQDGEYQIGYTLSYEELVGDLYKLYKVDDYSLAASATVYGATAAAAAYPVETAFTDELEPGWRPSDSGLVGDYEHGQSLIMDFTAPVKAERFVLTAPSPVYSTAKCVLFYSEDGVIWQRDDVTWTAKDSTWDMTVSTQTPHRYWKAFFWDGYVEVQIVKYTGTAFFADQRPTGPRTIAEPYIDELYADIPGAYIQLATMEIRDNQVVRVEDYRLSQITYEKYEPVASWITAFQDESVRKYFNDVVNYADKWLAPPTSVKSLYEELLEEDTFQLGSDLDYPRLDLPSTVILEPGYYFTYDDIDIQVDGEQNYWGSPTIIDILTPEITTESGIPLATQRNEAITIDRPGYKQLYSKKGKSTALGLATNPSSLQIQGDEVAVYESSNRVEPYHVMSVGYPEDESDLATKAYVDAALIVNMDNGAYD